MRSSLTIFFAVAFAIALCWPVILTGHIFTFSDTQSYVRGGEKIWDVFFRIIGDLLPASQAPTAEQAGGGTGSSGTPALASSDGSRNITGRSFTYSAFANLAYRLGGALAWAFAQAALATYMLSFLVSRTARQSPFVLAVGAVLIVAVTGLPWYASYLMPDIFGALAILFGIVLVRDIDDTGWFSTSFLVALAGFAAAAHYGNMPLIFAAVGAALGLRLLRWRLTWKSVIAGVVALSLAPIANLAASAVVLKEPSVTPARLPIVLTRSLADGPALWYLQDVCPEADLALCEAYGDDISGDTHEFLWSDTGILTLSKEQLDRIRAEEAQVVWGAFKAYPVAQTKSLFVNVYRQFYRIGISQLYTKARIGDGYEIIPVPEGTGFALNRAFDLIVPWATLFSLIAFAGAAARFGLSARWVDMLLVLGTGLVCNAMIFGGLSAPIDRYQGRMVWLIPVLLVLYLAETATHRRGSAQAA